jgi:hypothetical protein
VTPNTNLGDVYGGTTVLDPTTDALAHQGASFTYPTLPDKFTQTEDTLAQGYRKQLGYNRVIGIAIGAVIAGWLTDYVRGQK